MEEIKAVPRREEGDKKYQWHIEDLYASDALWEEDYKILEESIPTLASYEGRLGEGVHIFLAYMDKKQEIMKRFEAVYVYANQRYHEDTGNAVYQKLSAQAQMLSLKLSSATVFEEPELLAVGKETIDGWFAESEEMELYRRFFYELFRQQDHVLSKEMEAVLTDVSDMSEDISNIFSMFNNADVKFPSIRGKDGEEIPVSHGRYSLLMESRDRETRRKAFSSIYSQYGQYRNTLSTAPI